MSELYYIESRNDRSKELSSHSQPPLEHVGGGEQAGGELRGVQTPQLKKQLQGDLDWITLRALEKDRTKRYASAGELAADIRRHLNDEPVLASPPNVAYRARRFARRHRLRVAASAILAVGLLLGVAGIGYGLVRAP